MRSATNKRTQGGFTLLEMLVTSVILAFGLLGMAGLQAISLQNNNTAYFRTQANLLAYDIVDSMRANRTAALDDLYDVALGATPVSSDAIALADLIAWRSVLAGAMPAGDGAVNCDANNVCSITVQWTETGSGGVQEFVLSTQI